MTTLSLRVPILMMSSLLVGQAHAESKASDFQGLSAGLIAGYSMANPTMDRVLILTGAKDTSSPSVHGGMGGISLGYGHQFDNHLFLGVEASALWGGGQGKERASVNLGQPIESKIEQKQRLGFALHLGYALKNVLPYVKAGVALSQWRSQTDALPLLGAGSASSYRLGVDLGLGFQLSVSQRLSIGIEFSHAEYQSLKYSVNNNLGLKRLNVDIKPSDNIITLNIRLR